MKFTATTGIGGLAIRIFYPGRQVYGNGDMVIHIPQEFLSELAVAAIQTVRMDASEDLIRVARELVKATEPQQPKDLEPEWRQLSQPMQDELVEMRMELIREDAKDRAIEELDTLTLREIAEEQVLIYLDDDRDPTAEEIDQWIELHRAKKV